MEVEVTDKPKKKILVVDDEPDIVTGISDRLAFEGYEVITANDGQTALSIAREKNPDLIVLDIMLPKIDGFKVCRLLKFDKKKKHIPIIMLTAKTQETDIKTGKDMKADEYICKPFDQDELIKSIKKHLKE
ncbi:MAG: response regulator [Candidatus Aureabacteria bacterium]|nr:response regulator [Candidatus Auribacterota bacterium]